MYWGVPRDLRWCRCAGADVVYRANVAATETQARAFLEHDFVSWVSGSERECERYGHGRKGRREFVGFGKRIIGFGKTLIEVQNRVAGNGAVPIVVHSSEPMLEAQADIFPDPIFGFNQVSKRLTDEGETRERSDVSNGNSFENLDEELRWNDRDGAGKRR